MAITIDQIILDAKRVASRLKDREALGDSLLVETDKVNKQIKSQREFRDDIEALNKLAREKSNTQLINIIHQENPHIREIQQENKELRQCLEDHQRVLEHIMTKYREHTQQKIFTTKINLKEIYDGNKNELIRKQAEKIQEMAAIMQKAANIDEENANRDNEYISKLATENQGLRELLQISKQFGSLRQNILTLEDKGVQTEIDQTDNKTTATTTT